MCVCVWVCVCVCVGELTRTLPSLAQGMPFFMFCRSTRPSPPLAQTRHTSENDYTNQQSLL